jgi:hypothetical protein
MIAMTEGALRGVFSMNAITSGIQSDRIRRAAAAPTAAPPGPTTDSMTMTSATEPFICPITLDAEHDLVLLIKQGEPILADVEKRIVDDLLDCPLNLFKYSELVEKVIARLDMPVSLSAFEGAMKTVGGWETSPTTRAPILPGAICFGAAADHVKATQWTLAQLFTGGKLAGNADFWFATLWLILKKDDAHEWLRVLEPHARAQMSWRLTNSNTFIGLSGLPEFPTTRVPLDCAIWYVLASPLFAAEFGSASRDVLRGHLPHLTQLLELAALAKLEVPEELQRHYCRLKTMLRYLAWIKADRTALPMWTRMLIQAHVAVNPLNTSAKDAPKYVPIDGPPSAGQILDARSALARFASRADPLLTVAELVGIAGLVSPQKSASDIEMPLGMSFEEPVTGVVEWQYGLGPQVPINLTVSPATCRPLYMYGEETWRDQASRKYGPVEKQISVNAYYGKYVETYGAYPSRTDLLVFLYKRCVASGKHSTLPAHVRQFIDEVCEDYAPIVASVTPTEFVARWRASVRVEDRKRIEQTSAAPSSTEA